MVDVSKFLDWIKLSPRYLVPIALFTGFVLFASTEILEFFGLTGFVARYRPYFGLVFLLSAVLLLSGAAMAVYDCVKGWRREAQQRQQLRQQLRNLSRPEKEVLREFVRNDTTTLYLSMADGVVGGLETQRILYRSSNVGDIEEWAYNVQPWAWEHLKAHPQLLD